MLLATETKSLAAIPFSQPSDILILYVYMFNADYIRRNRKLCPRGDYTYDYIHRTMIVKQNN